MPTKRTITIDGSLGEGGGQILRTSLALSLITSQPIQIENIRAKRAKPGLMRQHLTAVRAAASIGNAKVDGDELRSQKLSFIPGKVTPGEYTFSIGTAGSTTLIFQTVFPVLMLADKPSVITVEGGTHNAMAPTFDFLSEVFLPVMKKIGIDASLKLNRAGFYPAGQGSFTATINPTKDFKNIEVLERGSLLSRKIIACLSGLPQEIAKRELRIASKTLDMQKEETETRNIDDAKSSGNVIYVQYQSENITEMFTAFGERGVSAERVAKEVSKEARRYANATSPVADHLADQLLVPLVLANGGAFRTLALSRHFTTNKAIIEKFLDAKIKTTREDRLSWLVEIEK